MFTDSRLAVQGILHIVLEHFRYGVIRDKLWPDQRVNKRNKVIFRIIDIVSVAVFDSVYPVSGILHERKGEVPPVVAFGSGNRPFEKYSRVGKIRIEHHSGIFERLEGIAVTHRTRHQHGVYALTCRKNIGESCKWIALVIVRDGIGKADGICRIAVKRLFETEHQTLALEFALYRLGKRRGEDYVLRVLDLDILVKFKIEPGILQRNVHSAGQGIDINDVRWNGILRSACWRLGRVGAGMHQQQGSEERHKRCSKYEVCLFHLTLYRFLRHPVCPESYATHLSSG